MLYTEDYILKIGVTFAEVKHQLSQKEHKQVEKGEAVMNIDNRSPSAFVVEGLELEETQCVVLSPLQFM